MVTTYCQGNSYSVPRVTMKIQCLQQNVKSSWSRGTPVHGPTLERTDRTELYGCAFRPCAGSNLTVGVWPVCGGDDRGHNLPSPTVRWSNRRERANDSSMSSVRTLRVTSHVDPLWGPPTLNLRRRWSIRRGHWIPRDGRPRHSDGKLLPLLVDLSTLLLSKFEVILPRGWSTRSFRRFRSPQI